MKSTLKVIKDNTARVVRDVEKLKGAALLVGVPQSEAQRGEGGLSNAEIAMINEFGSPMQNIPPRPFLLPAIEKNKDEIVAFIKDCVTTLGENRQRQALVKAGLLAQSKVKAYILDSGNFKPLSPVTIARRKDGRDKPLVDTAQLLNSVNFIVKV